LRRKEETALPGHTRPFIVAVTSLDVDLSLGLYADVDMVTSKPLDIESIDLSKLLPRLNRNSVPAAVPS